jgi:hypothetical protein
LEQASAITYVNTKCICHVSYSIMKEARFKECLWRNSDPTKV